MGFLTKLKNKLFGKRENSDKNKKAASKIDLKKQSGIKLEVDKVDAGDNTFPKPNAEGVRSSLSTVRDKFLSKDNSFKFAKLFNSPEDLTLDKSRVAFKAVRDGIAVLKIPAGERVIAASNSGAGMSGLYKMRATKAKVLGVYDILNKPNIITDRDVDRYINRETFELVESRMSRSLYDDSFVYRTGETVTPDHFDTSPVPCGGGIHFFATPKEAMRWYFL
jgi:hypothetical protein